MPLDMTSVLAVYLSLLRNCGVPIGCILALMAELYPSDPETTILRALSPVEVHFTLNVNVPASTSIAAVTSVTGGGNHTRASLTISSHHERWLLTGVEDIQSHWAPSVLLSCRVMCICICLCVFCMDIFGFVNMVVVIYLFLYLFIYLFTYGWYAMNFNFILT